jgi:cell division protein ZapA (FtsZ GTPase activity inhibitor)
MTNELCLDILGTSFTITADADKAYLDKVLAQYRAAVKNTQQISGISEPLNIAVLTGFMLCDELNKTEQFKTSVSDEQQEIEQRTLNVIAALEQALKTYTDE